VINASLLILFVGIIGWQVPRDVRLECITTAMSGKIECVGSEVYSQRSIRSTRFASKERTHLSHCGS